MIWPRSTQVHVPGRAHSPGHTARRELIIPSGAIGYLALLEIVDPANALVLAVRHQRESDYH